MTYATIMLQTHPRDVTLDEEALARCIDACHACAQACTACADACLGEDSVAHLVRCIRTDQDCADVCTATGRILSRQTEFGADLVRGILDACALACKTCGDECAQHGEHGMEHCRACAEACRACEQACNELLAAVGS